MSKFVPWREFDLKYADNFRSKKGQRACDSRMALGSVLIKIHYKGMSDEDLTKEIAMNPTCNTSSAFGNTGMNALSMRA